MLCEIIQKFEMSCACRMQVGLKIAEESRLLYGTQIKSAVHEPGISENLITDLYNARLNYLKVFVPPEKRTGGDIEIHIIFPDQTWVGFLIQAKKADLDHRGNFVFSELGHGNSHGKQYELLKASARNRQMLSCYLFYIPSDVVDAISGQRSGAMVCSALSLAGLISDADYGVDSILRMSIPLSELLCILDEQNKELFIGKVKYLFEVIGVAQKDIKIGCTKAPDNILNFYKVGKVPKKWKDENLVGALVAKFE